MYYINTRTKLLYITDCKQKDSRFCRQVCDKFYTRFILSCSNLNSKRIDERSVSTPYFRESS